MARQDLLWNIPFEVAYAILRTTLLLYTQGHSLWVMRKRLRNPFCTTLSCMIRIVQAASVNYILGPFCEDQFHACIFIEPTISVTNHAVKGALTCT